MEPPARPPAPTTPWAPAHVVLVSGSVGAGHDGVAHELARRLTGEGFVVEVVDLLEGFSATVALLLGSAYLLTLRTAPWVYEATCWLVERSRLFQRLADAVCCSANPWLLRRVQDADLVVATYPPAGRALGRLKRSGALRVPTATYLTDPAPNFLWVHPAIDLHLTTTLATAREAEQRYGVPMSVGGPLVDPVFRSTEPVAARAHLHEVVGAGPDDGVALLLLGSLGVGDVRPAATALRAAGLLPVVLCGRNARLRRRLQRVPGLVALGWRDDTASLVAGADLVVHNAGGLALTESMVAGVPSLTFAALPGHGRANAATLARSGAVPWARTPAALTTLAPVVAARLHAPWPEHEETAVKQLCALLGSRAA